MRTGKSRHSSKVGSPSDGEGKRRSMASWRGSVCGWIVAVMDTLPREGTVVLRVSVWREGW